MRGTVLGTVRLARPGRAGAPRWEVDVWTVPAPTPVRSEHAAVLDASERARAAGMPALASDRFVLGRALLRAVLAAHLDVAPASVRLSAVCPRCGGAHGRVVVAWPPGAEPTAAVLHVGVTRSGPLVAVAVTSAGPVGIDVESRARVGAASLAGVLPGGAAGPGRRPDGGRGGGRRDPARAWVRTEATLKALGTGLATDPAAVRLRPASPAWRGVDVVAHVGAPGRAGAQSDPVVVADLRLGRGVVGAVALVRPGAVGPDPATAGVATGPAPGGRLVVRRYEGAPVLDALRR